MNDNTPIIGDTWIWNGSDWIQQHPAISPPARDFASMAYDAATGQLILFGGGGSGPRIGGVIKLLLSRHLDLEWNELDPAVSGQCS